MAERNWDLVNDGLDILHHVLVLFVVPALSETYGEEGWWSEGVEPILTSGQRDDFEELSGDAELIYNIDVALALRIIERRWDEVFGSRLPPESLEWVDDLKDLRNEEAHRGVGDCSDEETKCWLDTMQRLCGEIDLEAAECIRGIRDKVGRDGEDDWESEPEPEVGRRPSSGRAPAAFRLSATVAAQEGRDLGDDLSRLVEELSREVGDRLCAVPGASLRVTLELSAGVSSGFDESVQDDVAKGCRALGIEDFEFED